MAEFPAFFVFDRDTKKILTNDGYTIMKSLYDLKKVVNCGGGCDNCKEEFSKQLDLQFWIRAASKKTSP